MVKLIGIVSVISAVTLLCACQELQTNPLTAPAASPVSKSITNRWHVSDAQAIAWLQHDQRTWSDKGKLVGVNWYVFWKEQLGAGTTLAKEAYSACHNNPSHGSNCQVYWQAYSMSNSEASRYWGNKMRDDE